MKGSTRTPEQKNENRTPNGSFQANENVNIATSDDANDITTMEKRSFLPGQNQTTETSTIQANTNSAYNETNQTSSTTSSRPPINTDGPSFVLTQNQSLPIASHRFLEAAICASILVQHAANLQQNQAFSHTENQQQNIQQQQHPSTVATTNSQTTTTNYNFQSPIHPSSTIGQTQNANLSTPSFFLPQNQQTMYGSISQTQHGMDNTTPNEGIILALEQDIDELSPYQCLVRKQIEAFQQEPKPNQTNPQLKHEEDDENEKAEQITAQGRNRPVVPGQVGIRCRHCGTAQPWKRARGAILFPSTLLGVYQTAQNMANTHLIKTCKMIPDTTRQELINIRSREEGKKTRKSSYGGGRQYWADSFRVLGVVEGSDRRLRFAAASNEGNGSDPSEDSKDDGNTDGGVSNPVE